MIINNRINKRIKLLLSVSIIFMTSFEAMSFETTAKQAILMDANTGTILLEKAAQDRVATASMSKLMTVYMILEKIDYGILSLEDEFIVSDNAWKKGGAATGGSTMFLNPKQKVTVDDLLHGIIIQSGNDACIVAAENMYGSEGKFAEEMNKKAKELGLYNSQFKNSTGLPEEGHYMSVEDIAKLSQIIIKRFPEYYNIFSQKEFTYNKIKQGNRNPLLYKMPGQADGLKTGHTQASGYGVATSVQSLDKTRRIILVVNGLETIKAREEETYYLANKALNTYDNYTAFKKGETITTLPVFLGEKEEVDIVLNEDLEMTLPRFQRTDVKFTIAYENPIKAPILTGDKLGMMMIKIPDMKDIQVPVYAGENIAEKGYFGRIKYWLDSIF